MPCFVDFRQKGKMTVSKQILGVMGWLLVSFLAAAIGAAASADAPSFYRELVRPNWAPPAWLFGPVWTMLYALMAMAAWLIWRTRSFGGARFALALFSVQLAVNALWSWIFFVWHSGKWATIEIVFLWVLVLTTMIQFWRISVTAGALLVPYLLWVTYASALAFTLWRLNPTVLG